LQLVGKRVVLRPPTHADLGGFRLMFTDEELMRYVAWGRPFTVAEVEELVARMIDRFESDGFGQFAVERHADGAFIGRAGLLPLDPVSIVQHGNDRSIRLAERLGGCPEREITTSFGKRATLFGYAAPAARAGSGRGGSRTE
jgi:Acetyltransferase (GNAT) domain